MIENKVLPPGVPVLPAICLILVSGTHAAISGNRYEPPPQLLAGEILSAGLLGSEHHRVLDEIGYDGHFFRFTLETEHGTEEVTSKALLKIRVHEAAAVAQVSNATFPHAGTTSQPGGRGYLTARPDDDRNNPGAEARFSQLRLSGAKKARPVQPAEDSLAVAPDNALPAGPDPVAEAHKRAVAARLQMDVYSSNRVARDMLDRLAAARATGKSLPGTGFYLERDPETKLARGLVEAEVHRALKDKTREQLRELNDRILADLMVPAGLRQQFLDHPAFSPRHTTYITAYLRYLGNIEGSGSLLQAALNADTESRALSYEQLARLLAVYRERVEVISRLDLAGSTVAARTESGVLVVAEPVDIVYWSEYFDSLTGTPGDAYEGATLRGRELVVTGMLTDKARRELEARGYTVRDRFLSLPAANLQGQ